MNDWAADFLQDMAAASKDIATVARIYTMEQTKYKNRAEWRSRRLRYVSEHHKNRGHRPFDQTRRQRLLAVMNIVDPPMGLRRLAEMVLKSEIHHMHQRLL